MKKISTPAKLASHRTLALPVISLKLLVAQPTKMLSKEMVYDNIYYNYWMDDARLFVKSNPHATLRDLQLHIFTLREKELDLDAMCGNFVWGYQGFAPVKRAIYEDAALNHFIKYENKWRVVFPIDRFGSLFGAREGYILPLSGYICTDGYHGATPHSP